MSHYLRVEAVNIYASIFDTDQISIIRGGSLLLKQAVDSLAGQFAADLEAISTGASVGLFQLSGNTPADTVKTNIINHLNAADSPYHPFTFVVALVQEANFLKAKEMLVAKCRLLQLQQPTLSTDGPSNNGKPAQPCELDGRRKAYGQALFAEDTSKTISPSATLKLKHGRKQRHQLYREELQAFASSSPTGGILNANLLKKLNDLEFTTELPELSAAPEFTKLNGKIAVIYFDGNKFSKIQSELVKNSQDQIEFDRQIKNLRRDFLVRLLDHCRQDSGWFYKHQMRLETLLWGGDEMLFVVPAWKGFEFVQFFYETSQNWVVSRNGQHKKLSHAGGIVFCQQNAPIYKMRSLAQQLADRIKEHPNSLGRTGNYYDYLVLESIDYPAEDLDTFFKHRYGDLASYRTYLSAQNLVATDLQSLAHLNGILPKSQIYTLALAARELAISQHQTTLDLTIGDWQIFSDTLKRLNALAENTLQENRLKDCLTALKPLLFPQTDYQLAAPTAGCNAFLANPNSLLNQDVIKQALLWLHLVQCHDYLWPMQQGA